MFTRVPWIVRLILGKCLWRVKTKEKLIYLTFDDGPTPEVTPLLLDILDEYGWKATFFCIGSNVEKYPEIYNDIIGRGHRVGNHTYSHLKGFSAKIEGYEQDVAKASEFIDSKLFRPPYGRVRPRQKRELRKQYNIVMWDVLTGDYNKNRTPDAIMQRIRRFSRKGSIVVFHDSVKARNNMLATLPRAIEFWNEHGYRHGLLE